MLEIRFDKITFVSNNRECARAASALKYTDSEISRALNARGNERFLNGSGAIKAPW